MDETLAAFRVHARSATQTQVASRRFRVCELDGLLMEHELAHAPRYEPARQAAARRDPPVNLHFRLATASRVARRRARQYAADRIHPDPLALADWASTVERYPLLTVVPRGYRTSRLTGALQRARWAVQRRIERNALLVRREKAHPS